MNAPLPDKPKDAVKSMQILFMALVAGMLMLAIVFIVLNLLADAPLKSDKEFFRIILTVVLFTSTILLTIGDKIFRKRITAARETGVSLIGKLHQYRAALLLYIALAEAAGLFALIIYFLTANKLMLVAAGLILIAMFLKRPEKSKIFNDLQLSSQEQSELN